MPSRMIPRTFTQHLTLVLCSALAAGALVCWWFSADKIQRLMSHQIALRAQVQAVQLAQYPDLIEAVNKRDARQVSQLVQALQSVTDADFITVSDRQGIRLAHPITARIGLPVMGMIFVLHWMKAKPTFLIVCNPWGHHCAIFRRFVLLTAM